MLALVVLTIVAATPLLEGFAAAQMARLEQSVETREDRQGGIVSFLLLSGATTRWYSRYSRGSEPLPPPDPPPPGGFPAPLFTSPSWATFNTTTNEYDGDPLTGNGKSFPDYATHYTGTVRNAATASEYIAALAASSDTDTVRVTATFTLSGANLILPKRADWATAPDGWVLTTTQGFSKAARARVVAADFSGLPQINVQAANNSFGLSFAAGGVSGYHFRGVRIENVTDSTGSGDCLGLFWHAYKNPATGGSQSSTADMPTRLIIEQCHLFNNWTTGGNRWCRRAIVEDGRYGIIRDNLMDGFAVRRATGDCQCIESFQGLGDWLWENNACEGGSETIALSGTSTSMGNQQYFANFIIRKNYLYRRTAWLTDPDVASTIKNFIEFKAGQFGVVDSNYLDGHNGAAQIADLVVKYGARGANDHLYVQTRDIRIRRTYSVNGVSPFAVDAGDTGPNFWPDNPVRRLQFDHNAFISRYTLDAGVLQQRYGGATDATHVIQDVVFDHNLFTLRHSLLMFTQQSALVVAPNTTFTNNLNVKNVQYGAVFSTQGSNKTAMDVFCGPTGWTFQRNATVDNQGITHCYGSGAFQTDNRHYSSVSSLEADLQDVPNLDYRVRSTSTKLYQAGLDGLDIGPDWAQLANAQAAK